MFRLLGLLAIFALAANVLGTVVPVLLSKLGVDPAVAGSPVISAHALQRA